MRRLSIGLIALILPVLPAMGFTVSGNVSGASGFLPVLVIYTIPTALDTFYVTIANPFNGNYSQGGLDSGGYTFMAFQDLDVNLVPDIDEPRGFYGGDIPTILQVAEDVSGIDIELTPPNPVFTGTVSYEGAETGATFISAHRTNTFEGLPSGGSVLLNNTGNGDYTAVVDSFGTYYAYAFMDVNTNFQFDEGEPYDVYGDDAEPEPITIEQGEQYPDGIDFELIATPSSTPPVRVASDFRLGHAYPNPFNAATTIPFSLDRQMEIELTAHDVLGRTVATLANGSYPAGEHSVKFGDGGLASGVYVIELRAHGVSTCTPAILLK